MNNFTRDIIDETIVKGFSKSDYSFYFHILAQCKVVLTDEVNIAGVNFKVSSYFLYINPKNFGPLPLNQRLGVLKHEMLHIIFNHIDRKEDRQHDQFNVAADCALNQQIDREDLPEGCIFPDVLEKKIGKKIPKNLSAEQYYDLLPYKKASDCEGGCEGGCEGNGEEVEDPGDFYKGLWSNNPLDDHNIWGESTGDEDLKRELTKRMIEQSISKSRGSIPLEINDMLNIWERKPVVSWKKVVRNIIGNKKVGKIPTIMRRSRRFPNRSEIKGYKKDRKFDIVVVIDVSGSMSNEEIIIGLNEIKHLANLTNSIIKIIQVDSEVHSVEDFEPKAFTRSAGGGTEMLPAWKHIKENKIPMDCAILISDMYIEDIHNWFDEGVAPKCKTVFLSTSGLNLDLNSYPRYVGFNIKDV